MGDDVVAVVAAAAALLPVRDKDHDVISSKIRADFFSFIIALVLWTAGKETDHEDEDEKVVKDDNIALRVDGVRCVLGLCYKKCQRSVVCCVWMVSYQT